MKGAIMSLSFLGGIFAFVFFFFFEVISDVCCVYDVLNVTLKLVCN